MPDAAASSRRAYGTALLLLVAGGALLLVGYSLRWASAEVPLLAGAEGATRSVDFSGQALLPAAAVSGWVALAAAAGIVATRSWGRSVVAVIAFLAGVAGLTGAVWFVVARTGLVEAAARTLTSQAGDSAASASQAGLGWLVTAIGGLLVSVAAAWTIVSGRRWPAMGARYERTPSRRAAMSPWDALDMGQDPTDDLVE